MEKIPTSEGNKTIPEIFSMLMYGSYAANRDYGMTHEQLISIGIGNDAMKELYASEMAAMPKQTFKTCAKFEPKPNGIGNHLDDSPEVRNPSIHRTY